MDHHTDQPKSKRKISFDNKYTPVIESQGNTQEQDLQLLQEAGKFRLLWVPLLILLLKLAALIILVCILPEQPWLAPAFLATQSDYLKGWGFRKKDNPDTS